MHEEAVALYERVVAQYADVRWNPSDSKDLRTIKEPAETWLAGYRELAVGRPAPEIEGQDIDGKPFRLSDYRGKVVVLVFWATWCKPCMELVPQERELATRMAGQRFALLGVNCDSKEDAMRGALAEEKITWPNWYDGGLGAGPIAERYRIQVIPAIYVIDPEGVIRNKNVRGATLDSAVQKLIREMGTMPTER
jgi:thiol-disulfide isomerase/thioredoxin